MAYDYEKSIRPGKLPHIWCPGCGHGIAMKGLIRAMDTCELDRTKTALVSGIGCAARFPYYERFYLAQALWQHPDPRLFQRRFLAFDLGRRCLQCALGLFEVGQDAHGAFVELASRSGQ